MTKISLKKNTVLGVQPGSNPPVLAWHRFDAKNDSGVVDHYIDDQLRAQVPIESFVEYVDTNSSFSGLVVKSS